MIPGIIIGIFTGAGYMFLCVLGGKRGGLVEALCGCCFVANCAPIVEVDEVSSLIFNHLSA